MRKLQLQSPSTLTQLLLPPLHVRNWKAQLGTWLQRWVASHRDLFPSLFLPKIRVVETRSATLGDRIYRTWQRRWTPDVSFPCRCSDIDDHRLHRAHEHAVMVGEFSRINADIDIDIMAASMKDQYFGDVDLLHQRFTTQLRKLAHRWHVHGSSLLTDLRPVLTQLSCLLVIHITTTNRGFSVLVGCNSRGSFSLSCTCDLPFVVRHTDAQDLLLGRSLFAVSRICSIFSL